MQPSARHPRGDPRADPPARAANESTWERATLIGLSAVLLGVRLVAAKRVGFGDSEALYASYALHPQAAYLDHPGLIGIVARAIGGGTAPTPERAHLVTSILSTLVPWLMAAVSRACGATWRRSFGAALVLALVPEMAVGLFALTPDLLLALFWTGALGFAAVGLRAPARGGRAALAFACAGILAGLAAVSKATGALLLVALGLTYAGRAARSHGRSLAPWAGLAAGLLLVSPVVAFEARTGWPMLGHRLVETQSAAGFSLRNAAALVGGQIAYLSPLVVLLAVQAMRALWRDRGDAVGALLFATCAVPAAILLPLCLWSRVAEPHWIAPAWLALVPAAARGDGAPSRRLATASAALAGACVAAVHAWVLLPQALVLAPGDYDARIDLANELYGWPDVTRIVRQEIDGARALGSTRGDVVVVGPHWVLCGQLEAALRGDPPVGCDTPIRDDFDSWWPRPRWRAAATIVWLSDARFGPPPELPSHKVLRTRGVSVFRAGRVVRRFSLRVLSRRSSNEDGEI